MTTNEILTDTIVVKIDGRTLDGRQIDNLLSVSIEQTWSAADRIELCFTERDDIGLDPSVGVGITAGISIGGTTHPLFAGQLTAIGYRWAYGEDTLVLEGYDARHKLTRTITPSTFERTSLGNVVSTIAERHKLTSKVPPALTKTEYPSWISAASDFAILQHISLLTGLPWTLADTTIVFHDPASSPTEVTLDATSLIDLELRATPLERSSFVEVHGWDPEAKKEVVGKSRRPNSPHQPADGLGTSKALDDKTATSWRSGPRDAQDAERLATAIGHRMNATEIVGRGMTRGNPAIKPGTAVKVESVSRRANGTYRVTEARHVYGHDTGSLRTHFRIGPTDASLADMLAPDAWEANALTHGVTVGVVTEVDYAGKKANPGQVRVKLPYIGDTVQTGWARLMSQGAGKDRGIVFVPEVGDEVLVAFEHGDLNRPYVLGSVWNDSGTAFDKVVDGNAINERGIVSRLGNRIRFLDTKEGDDTSGISIESDSAKTKLFFGYKRTALETQGRPLEITNGKASIKLDKDEITIAANKITIKSATGDVIVEGNNVKLTGKMNVDVTANSQVNVKGNASVTVESSGMTNVKGSMVKVN